MCNVVLAEYPGSYYDLQSVLSCGLDRLPSAKCSIEVLHEGMDKLPFYIVERTITAWIFFQHSTCTVGVQKFR
jgi:hypothetical protein